MRPRLLLVVLLIASPWLALSVSAAGPPECLKAPADIRDAEGPGVRADLAQTGCCYGNGGVCGCSAFGPVMCCDGRLSPTCLCRDDSPVTTLASYPEPPR